MDENLKKYIDELISEIQNELDEATATGNVAGYNTPNAFSDKGSSDKNRKKKMAKRIGYTLAGKIDESFMSDLDIIKKGSKDITDFVKRVLSDKQFKEVRTDKDFHKYLKSFYNESVNEAMVSPKNGHQFFQLTKDTPIKFIKSQSGMNAPGVFLHNKDGFIKGKKDAYLIDYFGAAFYVDLKNKFASKIYPMKDQTDLRYNSNFKETDKAPEMSDWKKFLKESVDEYKGTGKARGGSPEPKFKPEVTSDVKKVLELIKKGFYLVDNNTALEHKKGGYVKLSKRVTNYFNNIKESVNEGPMDRIFGGIPYTKKGKQSIVTMKLPDDVKERIIQRAKKEGKVAKPNNGGGVTVFESVNEAKVKRPVNRWLELKNDDTMHPHKKMAHGLKELKYQLAETEKFFTWYNKIKTMNELESSNYWKRTQSHIYKIKERLVNIARTIQEIEK